MGGSVHAPGDKLSALLDGDLSEREAGELRRHVAGCAACAAELGELESLRAALAAEAAHPPEPPRGPISDDGWARLAARLGPTPARPRRPLWRSWWAAPALAAAGFAIFVGAQRTWTSRHAVTPSDDQLIAEAERSFRDAEAGFQRALERLRTVSERARSRLPEAERARYDAAQAQLERAVEECRRVARERPADADAEELLFAAYRKQIDFMQGQLLRGGGAL